MLSVTIHDLGEDLKINHRLNAWSYQQNALTSFKGWQYVGFYRPSSKDPAKVRHVVFGRRCLDRPKHWEYLEFNDWDQTADDGHNTISIGICRGDGTVHVSFDHHCDQLKYRCSVKGLASNPERHSWEPSLFGPIVNCLGEGLVPYPVSYPRFVCVGNDMLLEMRIGKAGAGSDILYHYTSLFSTWKFIGTYLVGVGCNPYPNGLSYEENRHRLHVSWTNRHFIDYEGANDPDSDIHKAQAGPNGPENNQDLCYAFSDDNGRSWSTRFWKAGQSEVGRLSEDGSSGGIDSTSKDVVAIVIPKNSGIMNQEAQCVDTGGGFHVLNRDNVGGEERWKHYYLSPQTGRWTTTTVPICVPTATGPRGEISYNPGSNTLFFILPSNNVSETTLTILRATLADDGVPKDFDVVWQGEGFDGEPLVDAQTLLEPGLLSVFTTRKASETQGRRVVVLDFQLER